MHPVAVTPRPTEGFRTVLDDDQVTALDNTLARLRDAVGPHRLWQVNSTARGGGVAEMLSTLLPYALGAGIDLGWLVVEGDEAFFDVTKRLHNRLHDDEGDGCPLGPAERATYERTLAAEAETLLEQVAPGDVVILHDPQTAGLAPVLAQRGARVVWRSHIGVDTLGDLARGAWDFLRDDVLAAQALVFTRPSYVWEGLPPDRVQIAAPVIDVLSPKNQPLQPEARDAILHASGLIVDPRHPRSLAAFMDDGSRELVTRPVELVEDMQIPPDARLIAQVSRWDRLKDPVGLVTAFADHGPPDDDVHLVVAGPSLEGVTDDPESVEVFEDVVATWRELPADARERSHLVCVPMVDLAENAAIVNALQRRADVVVQKSLAEGFGLTVTEAMWKQRAVVASRVGGVQDQITHGEDGLLVDDPEDLAAFGQAFRDILADPDRARALGTAAHQRVCDNYLPLHYFAAEAAVVARTRAGQTT